MRPHKTYTHCVACAPVDERERLIREAHADDAAVALGEWQDGYHGEWDLVDADACPWCGNVMGHCSIAVCETAEGVRAGLL